MSISRIKILLSIGLTLACLSNFAQEIKEPKEIEKIIDKVIARAYQATVQIARYDSVAKRALPGIFSGAVVSAEGQILTAAHASQPGMYYEITFPNGQQYMAKGLGRISTGGFSNRKGSTSHDLAMLKMTTPGKWSFVEMAENANMKVGELCVSIASPASFANKKPNIRLGRLTNVDFKGGFFESTCKMEPGDSGGALFNSEGKLIGIHSWINNSEEVNFEAPVDLFKKYWSALNIPKDYKELPDTDQLVTARPSQKIITIPPIQELLTVPKKAAESAVRVNSVNGDKKLTILGILISYPSFAKSKTYLVSKSSMVGTEVKVVIDSVDQPAKVVSRDKENDLVLLEVSLPAQDNGIQLRSDRDTLGMQFANLGDLVVSALGNAKQYVSVLSTNFIKAPRGIGYFGAGATFIDQKITITNIARGMSADGILQLKDVITGINGVPISLPPHYGEQVSKYFAGDTITVELVREGKPMQVKLYYIPFRMSHTSERFAGGHSTKEDGYQKVLVHDGAILASECGGPVFNRKGDFYGINIARVSRTSTIMLPYDIISAFIEKSVTNL